MSEDENRPFWSTPPYILLTDVLQLDKIEPWNVDVGKLMSGFLQEMKRLGDIDFRVSGNALYSASILFMKKTRELVELGILPPEEESGEEDFEIPLIRPPFRLMNRRVTLQELLLAMDEVMKKGIRKRPAPTRQRKYRKIEPVTLTVDVTRANVEETIAEVYFDLLQIMDLGEVARFRDVLITNTRREIVRVFFAILHLYARGFLDIWMDENEETWIEIVEPPEGATLQREVIQEQLIEE